MPSKENDLLAKGATANLSTRRIPRILHQIYLNGELPNSLKENVNRLKARNRGWEHRLYDSTAAERFISQHYDERFLRAYQRIDERYGAARADLLRHLIIYRSGGVYCDIKSNFDLPLDKSINSSDSYLLAQWENGPGERHEGFGLHRDLKHIGGGEYITYFIVSEPYHAFSAAVIERILKNISSYRAWSAVGRTGVLRTTGPIAYTLAIHPILNEHAHRMVTQQELGAQPVATRDYANLPTVRTHYSALSSPVVKLGLMGQLGSRGFEVLRKIKKQML